MSNWERKVDPEFYVKEASLLGVASDFTSTFSAEGGLLAQIQGDRMLHAALILAFALVSVAAGGFGSLQSAGQWHLVFALTTLAVFTCWEPTWFTPQRPGDSPEARRTQRRRFALPFALVFVLAVGPAAFAGNADAAWIAGIAAAFLLLVWLMATGAHPASRSLATVLAFTAFAGALMVPIAHRLPTRPESVLIPALIATVLVAFALLRRNRSRPLFPVLASRLAALVLIVALAPSTLSAFGPRAFDPDIYWLGGLATAVVVAVLFAQERIRPWVGAPWNLFLTVILIHLWSMSQAPAVVAERPMLQIATVAVEFCLLCIVAARLLRCQIASRPLGFTLTQPLARVPLLDRSGHFSLETWID